MPRMPAPDSEEEDPKKKKKPELVVAIGVGSKPGGRKPAPGEPEQEKELSGASDPMESNAIQPKADGGFSASSGKASPEEALVVREDHHCKDCSNWMPQTGECSVVDGVWAPEDACLRYFEAGSPGDEAEELGTETTGAEQVELGSSMGVPA